MNPQQPQQPVQQPTQQPQQPVQEPIQQQPVQQPMPQQQVLVEEERGSVFKGIIKFLLGLVIVAMIGGLVLLVLWLIRFATAKGYLF
jgi:hypothetical protein